MANHLELAIRDIDAKVAELQETRRLLVKALGSMGSTGSVSGQRTRTMTPEGRLRIAEAQKARWAKVKANAAQSSTTSPNSTKKGKKTAATTKK